MPLDGDDVQGAVGGVGAEEVGRFPEVGADAGNVGGVQGIPLSDGRRGRLTGLRAEEVCSADGVGIVDGIAGENVEDPRAAGLFGERK